MAKSKVASCCGLKVEQMRMYTPAPMDLDSDTQLLSIGVYLPSMPVSKTAFYNAEKVNVFGCTGKALA